jgi:hypothetical protein
MKFNIVSDQQQTLTLDLPEFDGYEIFLAVRRAWHTSTWQQYQVWDENIEQRLQTVLNPDIL